MADGFRYDLIPPGTKVLCALSGGADSMYLLCRLLDGAEAGGYGVCAAHYNHKLRPTADRDEAFVRNWCAGKGISLTAERGDVAAQAAAQGIGLEECARQMRYAFLERTAEREGCALIATGHHQRDNAETVLMNLIRGCGLKGLSGIPERRGNVIRPMLAVSPREIGTYLDQRRIPHMEDETNTDQTYARNRVRYQLLPLLEELNPQAVSHIAAAALRVREDEQELDRQAAELLQSAAERRDGWTIPAAALTDHPRPSALRAVGRLLERAGLSGQAGHWEKILDLAAGEDPSAGLDVPGGKVRREYGLVVFDSGKGATAPPKELPLTEGTVRGGGWTVTCVPALCPDKAYAGPGEFYLRPGTYLLRARREGDTLRLGRRPKKTVKKLMIEEKVPALRRELFPLLEGEGRAAALAGFGPDWDFLARPGQEALHFIFEEIET